MKSQREREKKMSNVLHSVMFASETRLKRVISFLSTLFHQRQLPISLSNTSLTTSEIFIKSNSSETETETKENL